MIAVVELSDPPLRLPVGLNTLPRIIQKLTADIEAYNKIEPIWKSTNSAEASSPSKKQQQKLDHDQHYDLDGVSEANGKIVIPSSYEVKR
jgi:hypothetical protein